MKNFITFIIVLFSSFAVASIQVTGRVVDRDNSQPLIGANVIMVQNNTLNGTATDSLGQYIITNINLGKYELIVSYIGYDTYTEEIIINQETPDNYKLDIGLAQSSLIMD